MKIVFSAFVVFLISVATFAQNKNKKTTGNPIINGWYADPEVVIYGNNYWLYPTLSAPFEQQVFMDAFSSNDLITWKKHPHILDSSIIKWVKSALWAPAAIKKGNKYYLFFAANDIHDGTKEIGGIGVAVADKPEGPYKDYLQKPLVGDIYNGAQPIDQYVFKDTDGKYYLIYGGWSHCNIAKLKSDFTGFIPFGDGTTFKPITPNGYVEGPMMFVRKGKYYFMWSEGSWAHANYKVAYAMADNVLGPFKKMGIILKQDAKIATGAGHHSVMQIPKTNDWYIVYHRRPLSETDQNHRVTCIDKMYFEANGLIKPVKMTFEGVHRRKLN
ncbi:MAG: arabinan endo-1,5-alpha-L-arabinosidase [Sphingobacteriales bacterium]|nr:MAG: arabinan endo-1,5-alpha-L-arabinosidase [Sphingobacteriales bacterium]TAF81621.1 MAG: arabinan endo-1,5-alpha-L-arabinosidase [Sphingobacteriales bacterium]